MDGTINKGVILSIEGNTAKVAPWLMSASRTTPASYLQH